MEYIFETEHLRVRTFEIKDAKRLYENHLEKEVKRWIPNESYADIEETQEAIKFYVDCVNKFVRKNVKLGLCEKNGEEHAEFGGQICRSEWQG